jgi:DNA-binding HxlR family transcriptional regulator
MTEDRLSNYEVGSPTRLALNVLAHKWTLLIVLALRTRLITGREPGVAVD